ncbi:hypothetical protein [Streptomyces colonosanans]|uniref:Uncharacterized protein n=1 Tax=Streptomyces colonosanans TaxID=1428652 RepID=A0A1S2PFW9_9ACTN|nr:hypothetical protein [Streptomyces colonosanans]OIJ92506.1 hypothetical protein BIV24_13860 [Streptomyces colonosanans]
MTSPALDAALADIDTVFNGFASPDETGCGRCHLPHEVAFLRTPHVRVPPDVLRQFVFEVPDHFDDHAASMRRLLPQTARAMADGSLDGVGWGAHGLSRVDWRSWPAEQAAAIEAFLHAWWEDVLTAPEPPYPVDEIFETCAAISGTVTPLLDQWLPRSVADTHLVHCAGLWLPDLLDDLSPFCWLQRAEDTAVEELQSWLARYAPDRLRAQGEPGLAEQAAVLALPQEQRWDRLD